MQERHDRGGSERGQDNKQGSMEEYHHQLYRRPQMTGQAREEDLNLQRNVLYCTDSPRSSLDVSVN